MPLCFAAIVGSLAALWIVREPFQTEDTLEEPLYLARDLGHFGDDVCLVEDLSATEVMRASVLEEKPESARLHIDGWFKALAHLSAEPEDASNRMARRLGLEPAEVLQSYDGRHLPDRMENRTLLDARHGSSLWTAVEKLASVMMSAKILGKEPDPSALLEPRFVVNNAAP